MRKTVRILTGMPLTADQLASEINIALNCMGDEYIIDLIMELRSKLSDDAIENLEKRIKNGK